MISTLIALKSHRGLPSVVNPGVSGHGVNVTPFPVKP